ncbi:hypothetical protein ACHAXR_001132, partial [Thalassiosira sp. AJA248-18]
MPELPEVEHFRQILLPLAGTSKTTFSSAKCSKKCSYVVLECPPPLPTKRFPSQEVIDLVNQGCYVIKDVLRKGKVLCILLQKQNDISSAEKEEKKKRVGKSSALPANETSGDNNDETKIAITGKESMLYLSLHMGMTGRISSPEHVPGLESLSKDDAYPPPHTHLVIKSNGEEASFSDPRRFGSVLVGVGGEEDGIPTTFQDITSDALAASEAYCSATMAKSKGPGGDADMQQPTIVEQLMNRKKGIKGLLLDQRAVVSGVGNWVCDEVLYRSCIHPDQSYLNAAEAKTIAEEMYHVLSTAVKCLNDGDDFPEEWLFHRRWRNGGGGGNAKDFNGKTITFIQSGGRSTAIVTALQKNKGRKSLSQTKKSTTDAVSKKRSGK